MDAWLFQQYSRQQTTLAAPSGASRVQTISQTTVGPLLIAFANAQLQAQISQTKSSLNGATVTAVNTITSLTNSSSVITAANNNPCFSGCGPSTYACSSCVHNLTQTLINAGLSPTAAANISSALTSAKTSVTSSGGNWTATSHQINNVVSQTQQSGNLQTARNAVSPQMYTFQSPTFYIGMTASQFQQLRVNMPPNNVTFANLASTVLDASHIIQSVTNFQVGWVSQVPASRRRRTLPASSSALTVNFQYSISCLPSAAQCAITSSSANFPSLQSILNNVFNNMTIYVQPGWCQYYFPGNAVPNFNVTCITNWASNYCGSLVASEGVQNARAATNTVLYSFMKCGVSPTYSNGACFDTTYAAIAAQNASYYSSTVTCVVPSAASAASTGGSSSGGGIGLIAAAIGAGVGVLLIVIIIIVVRRRKNSGGSIKSAKVGGN